MASPESQLGTQIRDQFYDDPEQLSFELLRQGAGNDNHTQFTISSPEKPLPVVSATPPVALGRLDLQNRAGPPLPPSAPSPTRPFTANARRAAVRPRYVKPLLPQQHSAPTISGEPVDRQPTQRMYHSFAENTVGDTQPDSQIYKNWTSGSHVAGKGVSTNATSLLQLAAQERDSPFESVESSQEHPSEAVTSPTALQDLDGDDADDTQKQSIAPPTSPLKFATPGMAGRRTDVPGPELSSAMRTATTPGSALDAASFFPAGTGSGIPMSLTQIFNGTQAGTSPMLANLHDDAVFQRPSPNFQQPRHATADAADSSPIKPRNEPIIRLSSEPRAEYVTMKQSQERRSHEAEGSDAHPDVEQDSWEEAAMVQRQLAKRKARERLEIEAARTFQKVAAPSLPAPASRKGGRLPPRLRTDQVSKTAPRARISAYDGPYDDDELDSLPQSPLGESAKPADNQDASEPSEEDAPSVVQSSPLNQVQHTKEPVQVPRTSSHPLGALSGQTNHNPVPASPSRNPQGSPLRSLASQRADRLSQLRDGKDSFTIRDSQPQASQNDNIPRPKPLLLPSSPSSNMYSINNTTISRAGFTSQMVSSSVPPMPPRSSSVELGFVQADDDDGDERVPSSPPALSYHPPGDENEIVYDEHDYEEHHERIEREDITREDSVTSDAGVGNSECELAGKGNAEEVDGMEVETGGTIDGGDHDGEVPETAELADNLPSSQEEVDGSSLVSHAVQNRRVPAAKPYVKTRIQRQSTIPESDWVDDAQAPLFHSVDVGYQHQLKAGDHGASAPERQADAPGLQVASAQPTPTPTKQKNARASATPIKKGDQINDQRPFRSLNDIANQPDTQLTELDDIEIPHLQFATDDVEADFANQAIGSSPIQPSAKKRRITYSARRYRTDIKSPVKDLQIRNVTLSSPVRREHGPKTHIASPTGRRQTTRTAAANAAIEATASSALPVPSVITPTKHEVGKPRQAGGLKPVNKSLIQKLSPKVLKRTRASTVVLSPPSPHAERPDALSSDAIGSTSITSDDIADELAAPAEPVRPALIPEIQNGTERGGEVSADVVFPDRVFAFWPGGGYYPATTLGPAGPHRVHIQFDEGATTDLDLGQVRTLTLRKGDQVKVDKPGMKKHVYIVVGFKDKLSGPDGDRSPVLTDCYGHKTVVLEMKQRESLAASGEQKQQPAIHVPMERIYLTNQLCSKFYDRLYELSPPSSPYVSTPQPTVAPTPGTVHRSETHSFASTRRGTAGPSALRESLRAGSVASSTPGSDSTVFINMVFAVTMHDDEEESEKASLTRLIARNGGQVLDSFSELFEDTDASEAASQLNSMRRAKGKGSSTSSATSLMLKDEYKSLRFAALITDMHSRRTKYIQALALNIPCLHYRWLSDSIASGQPLPLGKYLLPAGLSTFLDPHGVVRSRNMALYDPNADDASLEETVKNRDMLLRDRSVLLIMGSSKKETERKKPYLFLTHALGPARVGRCADLAAAQELLENGKAQWDWVYIDGGVPGLSEAVAVLFGQGAKSAGSTSKPTQSKSSGKKRKRASDGSTTPGAETEGLVRAGTIRGRTVRLACDEFVIQSLILGALLEG